MLYATVYSLPSALLSQAAKVLLHDTLLQHTCLKCELKSTNDPTEMKANKTFVKPKLPRVPGQQPEQLPFCPSMGSNEATRVDREGSRGVESALQIKL